MLNMKSQCALFSLGLAALTYAEPTADTMTVCKALYAAYPQNFAWNPLGPNGAQTLTKAALYESTTSVYWNQENSENRAACMLFPSSAQQVGKAVKLLNKYKDASFAVKSGGHNPNVGFSSVEDGVLISMRPNLKDTKLSADKKTAVVGAGARWVEANTALEPYNLALVGGRIGHVGVGGYALGGGLSFLTSEYGFTCDNILNYEAVLADGTVTNINSGSHPDLYYAMKGGGNQFAIVTRYTMKARKVAPKIYGGMSIYSGSQHPQLLAATQNFIANNKDPKAAIIHTNLFFANNSVPIIIMFYFYNGEQVPKGVFDDYNAIPATLDMTSYQTYGALNRQTAPDGISTSNFLLRGATYPNLPKANMTSWLLEHHDLVQKTTFGIQNLDVTLSYAIQPLPVLLQQTSEDNGGNRLGLNPKNGDKLFMQYVLGWVDPLCNGAKCDGYITDAVNAATSNQKQIYGGIKPTKYKEGDVDFISYNPLFMNDAMYNQPVLKSYGDDTYNRLKKIQKRNDPNGFFASRENGFKYDE